MRTPASTVFGMVSGLSIPIPSEDANESEMQIVQMELVGELIEREDVGKAVFQRGVSFCPSLGDGVYTTTQSDLKQVYSRPTTSSVRIGTIFQDKTLPAFISTDDLLGKHFAILGTTGSGKSCAVALILRIFTKPPIWTSSPDPCGSWSPWLSNMTMTWEPETDTTRPIRVSS